MRALHAGSLLGYGATVALMRTLLASCSISVGIGWWLARTGSYTVSSMWWVAAIFTALRLIGNVAAVVRETAKVDAYCRTPEGRDSGLCEVPA